MKFEAGDDIRVVGSEAYGSISSVGYTDIINGERCWAVLLCQESVAALYPYKSDARILPERLLIKINKDY